MTDIAKTLDTAIEILEERGWRSGEGWVYTNEPIGKICLEGAIQLASGITMTPVKTSDGFNTYPDKIHEPLWNCPAYIAVQDELIERGVFADRNNKLWQFNDRSMNDYAPNKEKVIQLLRDVADKYRD